jgi:hypothetical protein
MTFFEEKFARRKLNGHREVRRVKMKLDQEVLDRVFYEDLDPNDELWKKLGYGQNRLSIILAKDDSPSNIKAKELSTAIMGMKSADTE